MTVKIRVATRTLEDIRKPESECRNCSGPGPVDIHGFCAECSDETQECCICGHEYLLSEDYEDDNVCPRCNPYYEKFNNAVGSFNALKDDILSLLRGAQCFKGIEPPVARELFRNVVNSFYKAGRTINGEVPYERNNRESI